MDSLVGLSTRMRMLAADEGLLMGSLAEVRRKSEMAVTAAVSWLMRLPSMSRPWLRGDLEAEDEDAAALAPEEAEEEEASARRGRDMVAMFECKGDGVT